MFDRLKCLVKGHDLRAAQYSGAYPSWVPPLIAHHLDSRVELKPAWISGFMHYGLYSVCERCGEGVSVGDDCGLPIVEPEFMKEARGRNPDKHGGKESAVRITQNF